MDTRHSISVTEVQKSEDEKLTETLREELEESCFARKQLNAVLYVSNRATCM